MFEHLPIRGFMLAACVSLLVGCGGSSTDSSPTDAGSGSSGGTTSSPNPPPATSAAPTVPTNLSATPGNAQARLSWSASDGATGYYVKRATTNGGPYAQMAAPSSTSFTDTTVSNGTTYYYVVSALDSAGQSADSTQVSAAPAATISIAPTPTGLTATAGNAQASLTWSASSGATNYHVKRATTSGGPYTQIGAPASASYTDTGLSNGTTYYYVVSALDSAGESANSAQVNVTPAAPVTAPVAPMGVAATAGNGQAGITWSASSGATSYHVKRATTNGGPYTQVAAPTSTSYTDGSLTNGTTYYYVVSAVNSAGESSNSTQVSAAPVAPPPPGTVPALVPGVWTEITPPAPGFSGTFGATMFDVSPVNPNVIYVSIDTLGMWKTTDRGSTWAKLGNYSNAYAGGTSTSYLDSPISVQVDPNDANHLIATQGVRGATLGFWVSHDAGNTWTMPAGFASLAASTTTVDVTLMAVDPSNFNHILLSSHSAWVGSSGAGIMETTDGGSTWAAHYGPGSGFPAGTLGINFLYDIAGGQGNSRTWLVGTDGDGFWRTADGGATWTQVSTQDTPHGGAFVYYAKNGTVYCGATPFPIRSTDNGVTWSQVSTGLTYFYYYTIWGDGNTLYTQLSYTGNNAGKGPQPYMVSSESDGSSWTAYQGGAQTFNDGPYSMQFDAVNGIMYSANWTSGFWALKVKP